MTLSKLYKFIFFIFAFSLAAFVIGKTAVHFMDQKEENDEFSLLSMPPPNEHLKSFHSYLPLSESNAKPDLSLSPANAITGEPSRAKPRICVLGFDGICWSVIKPLFNQGKLPNMKSLCRGGSYGVLKTDIGFSPVSWTSIFTGVGSDKHGIKFTPLNMERAWADSYGKGKKVFHVWDILASADWKTCIGYYPFLSQSDVKQDIKVGQNLDDDSWNAYFSLFSFTDDIQHKAYQYFQVLQTIKSDKSRLVAKPEVKDLIFQGAKDLSEAYESMDRIIGQAMQTNPDYFFIVSDHGFKNSEIVFTLSPTKLFFDQLGIFISESKAIGYGHLEGADVPIRLIGDDNFMPLTTKRFSTIEAPWFGFKGKNLDVKMTLRTPRFRIQSTKRFPPRSFEKLKEKAESLKWNQKPLLHVESTRQTIEFEIAKEAIENIQQGNWDSELFTIGLITANHDATTDGVIIMAGRGIRQAHELKDASVFDVTPTLLYLAGRPVAEDLDGKVLTDALIPGYQKTKPIKNISTYGRPKRDKLASSPLSNEERDRLKGLGYLQ